MASWSELADKIKARLKTLAAMQNVAVIVDEQKDLESVVTAALGKLGGAVVIAWKEGEMENKKTSKVQFYISFFGAPILRPGDSPQIDALIQAAFVALYDWLPEDASHCFDEVKITGPATPIILPNSSYACARFPVTVRVRLPDPSLIETP